MPVTTLASPTPKGGLSQETKFTLTIGGIAAAATIAQAVFAFWQYRFSESSFERQQELARAAAEESSKQTDRLIANAERLAASSEGATKENTLVNQRTAQLVKEAQEVFAAEAFPVVKVSGYQFHSTLKSLGQDSCTAPPHGIALKYANKSSIPLVTKSVKIWLRQADRDLFPERAKAPPSPVIKIMTASDEVSFGVGGPAFEKAFGARRVETDPPITAEIHILYQALSTKRCYRYRGKVQLLALCNLPNQYHFNIKEEAVDAVGCST